MFLYHSQTRLSDALKWRTFLRISILLLVLIGALFILDLVFNEKQFQIHRQNIQAQHAFQLERLVESSADKMIQISGAASLNDGLVKAIQSRQNYLINREIDTLDWHLQADAGLTVMGLFDTSGHALNQIETLNHSEHLQAVIQYERPAWKVDCTVACQILSYTPLLVDGNLLAVLVLAEPLSHVLLRFQHVANIDTGLLSELDTSNRDQQTFGNWQRYLEAVTSPDQSRPVLSQASKLFSLEELLQRPRVVDINDHIYELKALPFKSSQLVVMTEASSDYGLLAESKNKSIKLAILILFLGEIILLAFLWSPLSRLKFSERLVTLLAARRFDDIKYELEKAKPEHQHLAKAALDLEGAFMSMQREIAEQAACIDAFSDDVSHQQIGLIQLLNEMSIPVMILDEECRIQFSNEYLKTQLCLASVRLLGADISQFIQAEQGFKARLADVLSGSLSEFQHLAKCLDGQGNTHTFRWRYSICPAHFMTLNQGKRCLLVMGQSSSEISQDQKRRWCQEHDLDTAWLNAKGCVNALNHLLRLENNLAPQIQQHLVLVRFSAYLLEDSYVDRLVFLRFVSECFGALNNDKVSLLSRIEDNEFAFVICSSNIENELSRLKNQLSENLIENVTKEANSVYQIASYCIKPADFYGLDILALARSRYR